LNEKIEEENRRKKMDRSASDPAPLLCDGSPLATGTVGSEAGI
jgi:hypothetical protein